MMMQQLLKQSNKMKNDISLEVQRKAPHHSDLNSTSPLHNLTMRRYTVSMWFSFEAAGWLCSVDLYVVHHGTHMEHILWCRAARNVPLAMRSKRTHSAFMILYGRPVQLAARGPLTTSIWPFDYL